MQGPSSGDDEQGPIAQINIIPLVDVVLVLLIIFMVTTVFANDTSLKLNLPKGNRQEQMSQPPVEVTVSVDPQGNVFVNAQPTPVEDLAAKVSSYLNKSKETTLVLRGDRDAFYEKIMPVLDQVSRTGVKLTLALTPGTK